MHHISVTYHILWLNMPGIHVPPHASYPSYVSFHHVSSTKALIHCISSLHMNVRSQIERDSSDVDAFGHDTFLYLDCSIRIYFGDGEGTVAQRIHFALQGIAFQHDFIVNFGLVLNLLFSFSLLVRLRWSFFALRSFQFTVNAKSYNMSLPKAICPGVAFKLLWVVEQIAQVSLLSIPD